jgi:hypothetical protein
MILGCNCVSLGGQFLTLWWHYQLSKYQALLTQWHSVTSQKTWTYTQNCMYMQMSQKTINLSYTPLFPSLDRQKLQHSSWHCCQKAKTHSNGCIKDKVWSGLMQCFRSTVSHIVISCNFSNAFRIVKVICDNFKCAVESLQHGKMDLNFSVPRRSHPCLR